jgi:PBSX family phage terminase large subunit
VGRQINPNFQFLVESCTEQEYDNGELITGKRGVVLEGSSRSGKTYSSIDLIILLCVRYETNCVINVVKETYNEFKTTLYNDFSKRLNDFGLHNPFEDAKEVSSFKIFNNKINFLGADKPSKFHGAQCDYLWLNEPLPISQAIFDQAEMRCKKFWWMDLNPSLTEHWIFNSVITRPDVGFLRTTFEDNPFVSIPERNKILSYEPWKEDSYEVIDGVIYYNNEIVDEKNQPPPNLENIEAGTADEFMWKVYGLGLRGAMKGQIFKNVTYIDEFPDIAYTFGLDFGFTNDPTSLVKFAKEGKDIYLELLIYHPIDTPEELDATLEAVGADQYTPITADSSDKYTSERKGSVQMVRDLFDLGWEISKVTKTKSIMYWLTKMKECKIHIVRNDMYKHAKREQENYMFKEVNGILINQPEDKYNHFWDGSRYAFMSWDISNFSVTSN